MWSVYFWLRPNGRAVLSAVSVPTLAARGQMRLTDGQGGQPGRGSVLAT